MAQLLKRRDVYSAVTIDGELVMIHRDTGKFFALKDVGLRIWEELDRTSDLEEVCLSVEREYDVPADTCRHEVRTFAGQLVDAGFARFA